MGRFSHPPLPASDLSEISERVLAVADDLREASILITGGTGFVGTWLVESFLHLDAVANLGARVTVLTRNADAYGVAAPHLVSDPRLSVHLGTLGEFGTFQGLEGMTHIIHAGSNPHRATTPAGGLADLRVLDQGTEDLLVAAKRWPVKRLLYVSSAAVYGRVPENQAMNESSSNGPSALAPESVYGMGKRIAELRTCLHAAAAGYSAVIARLGAFIGPMLPLDSGFAAGNFLADALAGRRIRVQGDGQAVRSYQYAADMAVWLWMILLRGKSGEAYNVGGELPVSIQALAESIDRAAGLHGVAILGSPMLGAAPDRYSPSVEKAVNELGLENRIGLEESIRRTLRWHSAHLGVKMGSN